MTLAFLLGLLIGCILAALVCTIIVEHMENKYEITLEDGDQITGEIDNRMWLDMQTTRKALERAAKREKKGSDKWAVAWTIITFLTEWMEEPTREVRYGTVVPFDEPETD